MQNAVGQLVINEVCSSNRNNLADYEGDYPDWIELLNTSNSSLQLSNYYISDNEDNLSKFAFPNAQIAANSYLIIFASGKDVMANRIHTNFKISSEGEKLLLSNHNETVISSVNVPELCTDHSFGRSPNAGPSWYYYIDPTPGIANEPGIYYGYCPEPVLTLSSGFYNSGKKVNLITTFSDINVYYTTDGSEPDKNSTILDSDIQIDTTTVIRARAISDTLISLGLISHTYFIDENKSLPVVSLITDPYNLWDWENGIYVMGPDADSVFPYYGANFWRDTRIPVHIEYYTEAMELGFKEDFGMQMHGGRATRTKPMKALRIIADEDFGIAELSYNLFKDKEVNTFMRFVLRNSGSDFNKAHFRDGIIHKILIKNNLNLDVLAYKPTVVYINGQYWGIHNIREKVDKYYLHYNYDIDFEGLDLLEEESIVIEGDFDEFTEMYDFITTNDLSITNNYNHVTTLLDIENFTDYFIAETFFNNTDWPQNNLKYWRSDKHHGKFRYIFFDLDAALNNYGWSSENIDHLGDLFTSYYDNNKHVLILRNLLENQDYKYYFINRYADLVNTVFGTDNMLMEIDKQVVCLEQEIENHFNKWGGNSLTWWHNYHLALVYRFVENRPYYARAFIERLFELDGQIKLEINTDEGYSDLVHINTIKTDSSEWRGIYFQNIPVKFTISPSAEKIFNYWQIESTNEKISNLSFSRSFSSDEKVTAHFKHVNEILRVFPNPASNYVHIAFSLENEGDAEIFIHEFTGKEVASFKLENLETGYQLFEYFPEENLNGIYLISIKANNTVYNAEKVFIK